MNHESYLSAPLLDWYDRCARVMPWRGIQDPYRTWVSESMLQQTRVETVISYYDRFIRRFPTLPDLAAAEEAEVKAKIMAEEAPRKKSNGCIPAKTRTDME